MKNGYNDKVYYITIQETVYINEKEMISMAEKLVAKSDLMTSLYSKLKKEEAAFETSIRSMDRIIQQLPQAWEGQAAQAYVTQFNDLKPGFEKAKQTVGAIARQMDDILKIYQRTETEIARKLKSK